MAEGRFDRLAVPDEMRPEIRRLALLVDTTIDRDPGSTAAWSGMELALIEEAERVVGHPLHKGHALHNLGVAVYAANPLGARLYFIAAHIEDARTWVNRRPRAGFLAARMLRELYAFTIGKVRRLSRLARGNEQVPPLELAQHFENAEWLPPFSDPLPSNRSAADLAAIDPADRVFVGGSYRFAWDRINTMSRGVVDAHREPIVVAKFETPEGEDWRDKSFRILDECPLAVFDVTVLENPGQWPGIEHLAQVRPRPALFAYSTDDRSREYVAAGTFPTKKHIPDLDYLPFDSPEVLRNGVSRWLLLQHPRITATGRLVLGIGAAGDSATPGSTTARGSNSEPGAVLPTASGWLPEPIDGDPSKRD